MNESGGEARLTMADRLADKPCGVRRQFGKFIITFVTFLLYVDGLEYWLFVTHTFDPPHTYY